jgi:membrane-associated phospholipid phosphatase
MSFLSDPRVRPRLAIVAFVCLVGFIVIALLVRAGVTTGPDDIALAALATLHGGPLDPLMVAISELGVADILGFFTMVPAGFLWSLGARRAAVFVGSAYYLAAAATDIVKTAFALPRPSATYQIPLKMSETEDLIWAALAVLIVVALWRTRFRWGALLGAGLFALTIWIDPARLGTPGFDSFPSGHASRSIVLVLSLLIAMPWRPSTRVLVGLGAVLLAIGLSRVYLGEHNLSDVVAGWLGGIAFIAALALIPFFRERETIAPVETAGRERPAE